MLPLQDNSYAERFECLEEECLARSIIADSEYDVVKHELKASRRRPAGVRVERGLAAC